MGTRFDNDLGVAEGGIAITLRAPSAAELLSDPLAALQGNLAAVLAALATILLSAFAAAWLLRRSTARFREVARILSGSPNAPPAPGPLAALAAAQATRWGWVRTTLEERLRALERLDDAS